MRIAWNPCIMYIHPLIRNFDHGSRRPGETTKECCSGRAQLGLRRAATWFRLARSTCAKIADCFQEKVLKGYYVPAPRGQTANMSGLLSSRQIVSAYSAGFRFQILQAAAKLAR